VERISPTGLNGLQNIFPFIHASQNDSVEVYGIFAQITNSLWPISFSWCSF